MPLEVHYCGWVTELVGGGGVADPRAPSLRDEMDLSLSPMPYLKHMKVNGVTVIVCCTMYTL